MDLNNGLTVRSISQTLLRRRNLHEPFVENSRLPNLLCPKRRDEGAPARILELIRIAFDHFAYAKSGVLHRFRHLGTGEHRHVNGDGLAVPFLAMDLPFAD